MKDPFEFASELLKYAREELSNERGEKVEGMLNKHKALKELSDELKDKKHIGKELEIIHSFDTEKALIRIHKRQRFKNHLFISWGIAASVVISIGLTFLFFQNRAIQVKENKTIETKLAKSEVILEMYSGKKYRLDTLASSIYNTEENVIFDNREGTLQMEASNSLTSPNGSEYNKIHVPYGGSYILKLNDGTKITLNAGSVLEFPSRFGQSVRRVVLTGEAYFEVKRDEKRPFIVKTDNIEIKVLGTSFNVSSYFDEPGIYTTLVQGSIALIRKGKPERIIVPGEQARYDKNNGTLNLFKVDTNEFTAWKEGLFYFKDLPLEEILRKIARWYDLKIFYTNQEAKNLIFSGKLPIYSSVEDVLRKFELSGEVQFKLRNRTLTVSYK